MSEWPTLKLIDICVEKGVQTGPFGSQLHQKDYVSSGTPIITVEHLGDNKITEENYRMFPIKIETVSQSIVFVKATLFLVEWDQLIEELMYVRDRKGGCFLVVA